MASAASGSLLAPPADPVMDLSLSQRASTMTQPLITTLELNEGEYIRLRTIHRILLASIDDINTQYASDPATRHTKLVELQGYYEQERVRVLTPMQMGRLESRPVRNAVPAINPESGGFGWVPGLGRNTQPTA